MPVAAYAVRRMAGHTIAPDLRDIHMAGSTHDCCSIKKAPQERGFFMQAF